MIDFIHIVTEEKIQNNNLTGEGDYILSCKKGNTSKYDKFTLMGLDVSMTGKRTYIKGSLHKFWNRINLNDMDNNHNQFTYYEVCTAIDTLCEMIGVPPEKCILRGVEFGFNLTGMKFDPKQIIRDNIICHRNMYSPKRIDHKEFGYELQFFFSNWILKIYDKGKHQRQKESILRIEKKTRRKHKKINRLDQLKDLKVWDQMINELLECVKNLIIIDNPTYKEEISNPLHWQYLRKNKDRTTFKRRFDNLPDSYLKDDILKRIESTFKSLISNDFTSISSNPNLSNPLRNDIYYMRYRNDSKKSCKVTGLDISHQRRGSKFLSEKSIREIDQNTFQGLEVKYLTYEKKNLAKRRKAYFIAHNIRNKWYNSYQHYRRMREVVQMP